MSSSVSDKALPRRLAHTVGWASASRSFAISPRCTAEQLVAESDGEGHGSCFTLRLPMLGSKAVADRPISPALPTRSPGSMAPQRSMASRSWWWMTIRTHATSSAQRYVTLVRPSSRQHRCMKHWQSCANPLPHALVSDIAMPNGTGYELVRQVRAITEAATIPAIALTAFGRVEDRERALEAGFNFHMTKPVDPQHLVHVVVTALRG